MTRSPPRDSKGRVSKARDPLVRKVPEGDNRSRDVCPDCGYIKYENPKIVAAAVCLWNEGGEETGAEKILLCRRAIEPRIGFWTIPAGYLELGEEIDHITHPVMVLRSVPNQYNSFGPVEVPLGQYLMLGDNRDHSHDSRFWCAVPDENLVGKAFMVWMHWDSAGDGIGWNRIGNSIE